MSNESATYQQLQQTIAEPGCPICGLNQLAVYRYLDTLLWESSTDANLQEILAASLGFCGRHSRQLLTFGGQRLAAAVVERAALLAAIRRLPELASAPVEPARWPRLGPTRARTKARLGDASLPTTVEPCPACVREQAEEARGVQVLLAHLDEFSGPLLQAGGLCLPHFVLAAQMADARRQAVILSIQQTVWAELAENLEEFIRKHMEHHHTAPISEAGRTAVERTIAGLTGEYPVR